MNVVEPASTETDVTIMTQWKEGVAIITETENRSRSTSILTRRRRKLRSEDDYYNCDDMPDRCCGFLDQFKIRRQKMKMYRRERKAYNQGKRDGQQIGYFEGYAKGLHDGNPFNKLMEAVSNMVKIIEDNPELMAEAMRMKNLSPEELDAELEAEEEQEAEE